VKGAQRMRAKTTLKAGTGGKSGGKASGGKPSID
jgi:hypothetical protein